MPTIQVRAHLRRGRPVRAHGRIIAIRHGDMSGYRSKVGIPGYEIEYEDGCTRTLHYNDYNAAAWAAEEKARREGLQKTGPWNYRRV